jgi:hypothetical protein
MGTPQTQNDNNNNTDNDERGTENTLDAGTGISNRETPEEEGAEREAFPPIEYDKTPGEAEPRKTPGAFGKEGQPTQQDQAGSSHPDRK